METKNITEIIPEYVEEIKEISEHMNDLQSFYKTSKKDMSWMTRLFAPKTLDDFKNEKDLERFSQYFNKYVEEKLKSIQDDYIKPIQAELKSSMQELAEIKEPENPQLKSLYKQKSEIENELSQNESNYNKKCRNRNKQQEEELYDIARKRIAEINDLYKIDKEIEALIMQQSEIMWKSFAEEKQLICFPTFRSLKDMITSWQREKQYENEKYYFQAYDEYIKKLSTTAVDEETQKLIQEKREQKKKAYDEIEARYDTLKKLLENKHRIELDNVENEGHEVRKQAQQQLIDIENEIKILEETKTSTDLSQLYLKTCSNYDIAIKNYQAYLKVVENNYDILNQVSEKTKEVIYYTWQHRKSIKHLSQASDLSIVLKEVANNTFGVQDLINQMKDCSEKLLSLSQASEEILKLEE